jgi:hypothetical protein
MEFPHEPLLLRWTAAIKEKAEKLLGNAAGAKGYLDKGIVATDDTYVIAVNGRLLRGPHFATINGISQFPFAVEAAFAVGPIAVVINLDTGERCYWKYCRGRVGECDTEGLGSRGCWPNLSDLRHVHHAIASTALLGASHRNSNNAGQGVDDRAAAVSLTDLRNYLEHLHPMERVYGPDLGLRDERSLLTHLVGRIADERYRLFVLRV